MVRVLRVLCREDFSIQSAKMFAVDLKMAVEWLDAHFIYTKEQACTLAGRLPLELARCFALVLLAICRQLLRRDSRSSAEGMQVMKSSLSYPPSRSCAGMCIWLV